MKGGCTHSLAGLAQRLCSTLGGVHDASVTREMYSLDRLSRVLVGERDTSDRGCRCVPGAWGITRQGCVGRLGEIVSVTIQDAWRGQGLGPGGKHSEAIVTHTSTPSIWNGTGSGQLCSGKSCSEKGNTVGLRMLHTIRRPSRRVCWSLRVPHPRQATWLRHRAASA